MVATPIIVILALLGFIIRSPLNIILSISFYATSVIALAETVYHLLLTIFHPYRKNKPEALKEKELLEISFFTNFSAAAIGLFYNFFSYKLDPTELNARYFTKKSSCIPIFYRNVGKEYYNFTHPRPALNSRKTKDAKQGADFILEWIIPNLSNHTRQAFITLDRNSYIMCFVLSKAIFLYGFRNLAPLPRFFPNYVNREIQKLAIEPISTEKLEKITHFFRNLENCVADHLVINKDTPLIKRIYQIYPLFENSIFQDFSIHIARSRFSDSA